MLVDISDVQFLKWDARKARTLRAYRQAANMTLRRLGDKIKEKGGNCSYANIRNLETNDFQEYVSVDALVSLCEALEIPLSKFVSVTPKK